MTRSSGVERGHGAAAVIRSTKEECKDRGLKVCYHIMPGLPGSSPENDLKCFKRVFDDRFQAGHAEATSSVAHSGGGRYKTLRLVGDYTPLDVDTAVELLSQMKAYVPEYVRVQRIREDIPVPQIACGILKSNIRAAGPAA